MKKVIRDGKVAVLYSPGYGAGWSTWGAPEEFIFDPEVVALVEAEANAKIEKLIKKRGFDFYCGGAKNLRIEWLTVGTKFKIEEYDGNESVVVLEEVDWLEA